jgi:exonuclease SbcD
MRLLHTSDWHLGRSFHGVDLLAAQSAFLDHLVDTVRAERVDAVLVAGDVYDRALPPVDAVQLCGEALARIAAAGARVVLISGNHDSATRLGWGSALLPAAGVHVRTALRQAGTPVLLPDRDGDVAVYAVPYLEPDAVWAEVAAEAPGPVRSHDAVLRCALDRARRELADRPGTRSVALAHAFVTGGQPCASERDICVGGVAAVGRSAVTGFDYVGLGHLHGPQVLADGLRYSGSPLAYSFSEAGQRKGCWLVELGPAGLTGVERVPAPVPRPLARLRGRLTDLLADPGHGPHEQHYLSVTLTDPTRPVDAMARLRRRFPQAVCLDWEPDGARGDGADSYAARVRGRADVDLAAGFVAHVRGTPATPGELRLLDAALTAGQDPGVRC